MLSETFLYGTRDSVFAGILQQVTAIAGRYLVSPNYGHDLNTNNLQQFLKDNKFGLVNPDQKYPLAVLITPVSTIINLHGNDWEHFAFSLFFLQQSFTQQIDNDTNVSAQPVYEDWSQMKDAAIQFKNLLKATLKGQVTIQEQQYPFSLYVNADFEKLYIRRLSNFSNDNISGVELGFNLLLNINQCETIVDGDVHYVVSQLLDEVDPIWGTEKINYFTKDEVSSLLASLGGGISVVAGQDLSSGRIVYVHDNKAYYYDPSDNDLAGLTLGVTLTAAITDTPVDVQLSGIFHQNGLGLIPDNRYYIGANGTLTNNPNGLSVVQQVGASIDTDRLTINFYLPIITI